MKSKYRVITYTEKDGNREHIKYCGADTTVENIYDWLAGICELHGFTTNTSIEKLIH